MFFCSGCTILHFHQQCLKLQNFPFLCQQLFSVLFLINHSHPSGCKAISLYCFLFVVLTCISLMTNEADSLFMCFCGHLYIIFKAMSILNPISKTGLFFTHWVIRVHSMYYLCILCMVFFEISTFSISTKSICSFFFCCLYFCCFI